MVLSFFFYQELYSAKEMFKKIQITALILFIKHIVVNAFNWVISTQPIIRIIYKF